MNIQLFSEWHQTEFALKLPKYFNILRHSTSSNRDSTQRNPTAFNTFLPNLMKSNSFLDRIQVDSTVGLLVLR